MCPQVGEIIVPGDKIAFYQCGVNHEMLAQRQPDPQAAQGCSCRMVKASGDVSPVEARVQPIGMVQAQAGSVPPRRKNYPVPPSGMRKAGLPVRRKAAPPSAKR